MSATTNSPRTPLSAALHYVDGIEPPFHIFDADAGDTLLQDAQGASLPTELLPGVIRRAACVAVKQWGLNPLRDDVALVVTELVTNATRHGGGIVHFRMCHYADDAVRIEVVQRSCGEPVVLRPRWNQQSGRGMILINGVADAWGVGEDGTTTWCSFAARSGGQPE
ncbi:ATP-binding protein [Streptomyces sp. CA-111067]|uniref:ATP-binding protein n=1 Tax=Streptomyces sp. CA-111067 TaxID=3240046 RepID=UPI003D99BDE4